MCGMRAKKSFFTIAGFLFFCLFSNCLALAPKPPPETRTVSDNRTSSDNRTIKIASFNIQIFGKTKAAKPEVMHILAAIISQFDIVAIQEVKDASGAAIQSLEAQVDALGRDYAYIVSPRLGRSTSKEQYAFIYRTDSIQPIGNYTFNDTAGVFARPPFIGYFKTKSGNFDFILIDIHTAPSDATAEIKALPAVITDAQRHFKEKDAILGGDFNSDCSYFNENTYPAIFSPTEYKWIISNSEDTTVGTTNCTYDRIVITNTANEDYASKYGVYSFDSGMIQADAKQVSDHRAVWAEFFIGRDTD